tara:strand:- start:576 stop:1070 length:495 start_codon:yes stop_codon:yes gene_type:complete
MNTKDRGLEMAIVKATKHLHDLRLSSNDVEIIKVLFRIAYKENDIHLYSVGTRERKIVEANMCIVNAIRRNFSFPLTLIGKVMGRHHSSMVYYLKVHDSFLKDDDKYLILFQKLNTAIKDYLRYQDEIMALYKSANTIKDEIIVKLRCEVENLTFELESLKVIE